MTQNMLIIQFFTSLYRASLLINMSATFHHSSADLNPDCQLGKVVFNHRQQHRNINERSFLSVPASDNDLDVSPLLLPFHSAQVVWSHGGRELSSSALVLWKHRLAQEQTLNQHTDKRNNLSGVTAAKAVRAVCPTRRVQLACSVS